MHPYYHPTTLLVLDDDPYYVESFKFHFGDQFPCVSYTQPEHAIEHMLSQESRRPTFDNVLQRTIASPGAAQDPQVYGFAAEVEAEQRAEIRRMQLLLAAPTRCLIPK